MRTKGDDRDSKTEKKRKQKKKQQKCHTLPETVSPS